MSEVNYDLAYAFCELRDARPAYERAAAFYEGTIAEVYSSPKVRRLLAKSGTHDMDRFNFSHIPVDAIANKLSIVSVSADDGSDNSEADQVMEDLWEYNELAEESRIAHRKAGMYGDYYMMVWPVVGDDTPDTRKTPPKELAEILGDAAELTVNEPISDEVPDKTIVAVDMTFHDPLTTRMFYNTENPLKKAYVIRSWVEGDKFDKEITRANLYYSDRIERYFYQGKPPKVRSKQVNWTPYTADGNPAVLVNPFGEIPFFHFRNDRPYGKPDHINAFGPQLAINKIITSHLSNLDYQSFPQRYGLIDPVADQAGAQGADFNPFAPEDGDDPEDEDNESQLSADPSSFWDLKGYKEVGQFQPADPGVYLKPFDRYVQAMSQVTDTPMHFFAKDSTERPPSGEMLRVVNEPIDAKAEERQETFGGTWRKSYTFALSMMGIDADKITINWRPVETVTDFVGWQTVQMKQLCGVPQDVSLEETGYQPSMVSQWKKDADEKAASDEAKALHKTEQEAAIAAKFSNTPTNSSNPAEGKLPAASGNQ